MSAQRSKLRVVVDGSNLATEGRSDPSLVQLDEVLRAFQAENPGAELIVVADATFAHRVAPGERARFQERELEGTIVTPPAGAIGRGDAFILKIADRIAGVVLSNDSFQEFHHLYPWLFDEGRLIGGKPVPGVGWIFTPRLPVRGAKSVRATKKAALAVTSAPPAELTEAPPTKRAARGRRAASAELAVAPPAELTEAPPTKRAARGRRAASAELAVAPPAELTEAPPTKRAARGRRAASAELAVAPPTKRGARGRQAASAEPTVAPPTEPAVAAPPAATKRTARGRRAASAEPAVAPPTEPAVAAPPAATKRTARGRRAASAEPAVAPPTEPAVAAPPAATKRTARGRRAASAELAVAPPAEPTEAPPTKRAARGRRAASAELAVAAPPAPTKRAARPRPPEPPAELSSSTPRSQRREHGAVNDERTFAALTAAVPVGSVVDGTVRSFTSHGAVVDVRVDGVDVECYAPTAMLGDPAPARAREVLVRGEVRRFRLISVDPERRIGEVGLP